MANAKGEHAEVHCQGVSHWDEPCSLPATQHCEQCGVWFCQEHFLDPDWHLCLANH